jgi:type II secretory pathway pseudopilin PulG
MNKMTQDKKFRPRGGSSQSGKNRPTHNSEAGFYLIELVMVAIIVLIISAMAIPAITTSMRNARMRGATNDLTGIYEQARTFSIRDNRYYSAYILAASGSSPQLGYVDMLPKSNSGTSGNGGTSVASGDPEVVLSSDVVQEPAANAPNTTNLENDLLPATTPVTPTDTYVTAATFGPRGLPCTSISVTGGSVCDSSGGPTAYWTFLENTTTSTWQAVTITPAGRIQQWYYDGTNWDKL